jgi:nucleoside-diphosphate-sugar epimerase
VKILVTGASGFIGRALLERLRAEPRFELIAAVRRPILRPVVGVRYVLVTELGPNTVWTEAVHGVDVLVHTAARVHVMNPGSEDDRLFRETNVEGTRQLALSAIRCGVKRFIYLSSIKVNGDATTDAPFTPHDAPRPGDPYGVSKYEAERVLLALAKESRLEVSIIRPPLVYGPGVRANFLQLLSLVRAGIPMPFGAVRNARSLVSVWNLCDLIKHLIDAPLGTSRVFMVSDGEDVSSADLIRRIAHAMHRPARLLPVPKSLLNLLGVLARRSAQVSRLVGSLQVDISETKSALGWEPALTLDEGIRRTVEWFNTRADSK